MAEILGKFVDRKYYNDLKPTKLEESQLAIDGLYGVMLALDADRPASILLPALVTGRGPRRVRQSQLLYTSMLNRQEQPTPVHVELTDGLFKQFDSGILVPQGKARPIVTEGFYLAHPEISARAEELHVKLLAGRTTIYAANAQ